jgi:hypothetical protein
MKKSRSKSLINRRVREGWPCKFKAATCGAWRQWRHEEETATATEANMTSRRKKTEWSLGFSCVWCYGSMGTSPQLNRYRYESSRPLSDGAQRRARHRHQGPPPMQLHPLASLEPQHHSQASPPTSMLSYSLTLDPSISSHTLKQPCSKWAMCLADNPALA